jgi:hypothetical protein
MMPVAAKETLSLKHFILRSQVLSLYRAVIRTVCRLRRAGDQNMAGEMHQWTRHELEYYRKETDVSRIEYLLAKGRNEWRDMEKTLRLAGRLK